jgi:hypothetical protein
MCPQEHLVIISNTTGLSFALESIGPLATIIITVFYLFVLYLLALSNTPENQFASIYSESLIKTACQHLLLLVGFNTLIYRKYYDTPPILVGHYYPNRSKSYRFYCPDRYTQFVEMRHAVLLEDELMRGSMVAWKIDLEEKRVHAPNPMTQSHFFAPCCATIDNP